MYYDIVAICSNNSMMFLAYLWCAFMMLTYNVSIDISRKDDFWEVYIISKKNEYSEMQRVHYNETSKVKKNE